MSSVVRPKTSIGLEIEINGMTRELEIYVDWNLWGAAAEHCGRELRTKPCVGISGLTHLRKSLISMEKGAEHVTFDNAGTHIHIDFLNDIASNNASQLQRKAAKYRNNKYINPTGSGKKWYWIDPSGKYWSSPKGWIEKTATNTKPHPNSVYERTGVYKRQLLNVKRFMAIGIRFADTLFALQHPDRRFNKYCHSLASWNEDLMFKMTSVRSIAVHPNLQQRHRRHMFNLLSFAKWGTVEVRMIKASLNTEEIWAQIVLFTKMARMAKLNIGLPEATGRITTDFTILLNFCNIHGKYRKILVNMFNENISQKQFWCYCFRCYERYRQTEVYDYGLSRPVCRHCHQNHAVCIHCGRLINRSTAPLKLKMDDAIDGGRFICSHCYEHIGKRHIRAIETAGGFCKALNANVGSGFSKHGMRQLRKMRELFT